MCFYCLCVFSVLYCYCIDICIDVRLSHLMFCTINAIFCVFLCYRILFFKGHRKSLFEPGVSYSTSMSLVCIATSLIFEQIK